MEPRLLSFLLGALGVAFGAGGTLAMIRGRVIALEREVKEAKREIKNRQTVDRCRDEHEHVKLDFSELKQQNRDLLQMVGDLGTEFRGSMKTLHQRIDEVFKR